MGQIDREQEYQKLVQENIILRQFLTEAYEIIEYYSHEQNGKKAREYMLVFLRVGLQGVGIPRDIQND